jgi:very-short-patch-repair endonuclease
VHHESDKSGLLARFRHSRRPELAISAIAEAQHGVISLAQLFGIGLTEDEVRHRVKVGWLRRAHRGVFAVGYDPLTPEGYWCAAVLAVGPGAVLSHRSAAELWDLVRVRKGDAHVIVSSVQRRRHVGVMPHRNILDKGETAERRGIPVTTPLRTIIDLAAVADSACVERAIRQAEYDHLVTPASLVDAVERAAGRRGMRNLRRVLGRISETPGLTRSALEQKFVRFLRVHALPRPKLNAKVHVGRRWYEVDCLWPKQRVIVELDGRAAHHTAAAFESDRARDAALQAAGYLVVRLTWRRLRDDANAVASELRAILASRE